ncbi:MAG: SH3 domain-containing protein [Prevotellaceae bacterium]|jgi:hypothetical protein|nr:SH3 domain-containing protein [Prevotellaceae bacterium]
MKYLYVLFLMALLLMGCASNKLDRCYSDSNNIVEDISISFTPKLLPLTITYSWENGFYISPSFTFYTEYGDITFSASLKKTNSKHDVKIILRNNSENGWGDRTYYLENTDNIEVHTTHGIGNFTIEYHKDVLLIDLTEETDLQVEVLVNNVYSSVYSTKNQLKVTAKTVLNVRYGPGKDYEIYDKLNNGEYVENTGVYKYVKGNKWIEICYNGYKLWVSAKYVQ